VRAGEADVFVGEDARGGRLSIEQGEDALRDGGAAHAHVDRDKREGLRGVGRLSQIRSGIDVWFKKEKIGGKARKRVHGQLNIIITNDESTRNTLMPRRGENAKEQRRTARDRAPALPHEIKRENNEGTLPNRKEQTAQGRARPKSLSRARGGGASTSA
jgi:hypothetical protein